ncbi:MAG: hypothetical protein N4A36_00205 [Candidatus Gracilibacteria bacterium]|jgi:hypothetical protein|nr:hypothetical protein [Candidatus Gracilibacteria bacterium]
MTHYTEIGLKHLIHFEEVYFFLHVEAIPIFEQLKNVNYLIMCRKLLSNREPKGGKPLKQALPRLEKELISADCLNGGAYRSRHSAPSYRFA